MLQSIFGRLFGDWREVYITVEESEFKRLTGLLKSNSIRYRYKIRTSPDEKPLYNEKVFYIDVPAKDIAKARELLGLVPTAK